MSYENRHVIRDGRITLYTRNRTTTYHARLKIEGVQGYIIRSTKRESLAEAVRFAEDLYDDLRYKVRQGLEVRPQTFASLWKRWLEANKSMLSVHRIRYISGTAERYFLPFFGEKSLEEINNYFVEQYWTWRINFWQSPEGIAKILSAKKSRTTHKRPYKQKLGNIAKVPAQKSLQMEQSALRQIFHWANRTGLIGQIPEIRYPRKKGPKQISRRPAFSLEEWQKIYRYLRV